MVIFHSYVSYNQRVKSSDIDIETKNPPPRTLDGRWSAARSLEEPKKAPNFEFVAGSRNCWQWEIPMAMDIFWGKSSTLW
jgi:hypothetical protein